MRRYGPKTRYKITSRQLAILLLVLKYRFVSSDLLANCLGKDRSTIYERLSVLVDQGYIARIYDKSYRLRQRPVIYYLAPAGIRYLKKAGYQKTQLHYKSKDFTDDQIDDQFLLSKMAQTIHKSYNNSFSLLTKYQFGAEVFPLTPPFYAKLEAEDDSTPDYFIEYFPPYYESWKIRKRIGSYVDYVDEHDEYTHPHLLFICGNHNTEKRVVRMSTDLYSDFDLFTTTKERVLSGDKAIWLRPYEVDWDDELEYHELPIEYEN